MDMNEYWAMKPANELCAELDKKQDTLKKWFQSTGLLVKCLTAWQYYFGKHFKTSSNMNESQIIKAGKDGEFTLLKVNHFRNLIRHTLSLTTNQKPAFDVRAINSDTESTNQARLANSILDAYLKEKKIGRYINLAAEHALVLGTGFLYQKWEPSSGEPIQAIRQEDGTLRVEYEGDVEASAPTIFSVLLDPTVEDWQKLNWFRVTEYANKFDLAARHPDLEEEIMALPSFSDSNEMESFSFMDHKDESDVPIYSFYHKRTPSMPNGRYVLYCSEQVVLYDGPFPYEKLNLHRIIPGHTFGSIYGYTDFFDILPIQEATNSLLSALVSNNTAFAVQSVLCPKGANVTVEEISEGLSLVHYNPAAGKPEPMQLTASAPETYQLLELLNSYKQTLSAINDAARGNPGKDMSGVAISLIESRAIQYTSQFQQSWAELVEDSGEFTLDLLRTFANTKRMIAMAGKHNRGYMTSFTKDDLSNVRRVTVDIGNPMARLMSGRLSMADSLMGHGLIKNPQEYFTVLTSGSLETMTEGPQSQITAIEQENEMLMEGRFDEVHALLGDANLAHAAKHLTLVANPEVRSNSRLLNGILHHVAEHMDLYKTQPPEYAVLSGEPPYQAPPPPMPVGPSPSGPQESPVPTPQEAINMGDQVTPEQMIGVQ